MMPQTDDLITDMDTLRNERSTVQVSHPGTQLSAPKKSQDIAQGNQYETEVLE